MSKKTKKNSREILQKMPPKQREALKRMSGVQAMLFIGEYLKAHGIDSPNLMITDEGVPKGADAVTRVNPKNPTFGSIRIRPKVLKNPPKRDIPTEFTQIQNLLAHEGVHFADILDRGTSDHGSKFKKRAKDMGVHISRKDT